MNSLTLSYLVTEGEVGNVLTLNFNVQVQSRSTRKDRRRVKIDRVWEEEELAEALELVEEALEQNKPIPKAALRKVVRLPGVKQAVRRALQERDDDDAALLLLVA